MTDTTHKTATEVARELEQSRKMHIKDVKTRADAVKFVFDTVPAAKTAPYNSVARAIIEVMVARLERHLTLPKIAALLAAESTLHIGVWLTPQHFSDACVEHTFVSLNLYGIPGIDDGAGRKEIAIATQNAMKLAFPDVTKNLRGLSDE